MSIVEGAGGLVEQRRSTGGTVNNKKRRSSCSGSRTTKRIKKLPLRLSTLQNLFLACCDVFKGTATVPSSGDVHKLCHILDGMMPEDVGLSHDLQFFKPKFVVESNPRVTYTTIYKCDNFSLCIFFLPAKAVIPLHNHPGMTVFSKLLLGTMHIKAYDWIDPLSVAEENENGVVTKLARLKYNRTYTAPCSTSVLYPTSGGNIHEFKAITPCAVLDVLGPPYSKDDGRDCSYYRDFPYSALSKGRTLEAEEDDALYGWLEEIEMPVESVMDVIQYLGPQVAVTSS